MTPESRTVRARVFRGEPLADEEVRPTAVRGDLVRVRLGASGVCGSDLHVADGALGDLRRAAGLRTIVRMGEEA